MPSLLLMMLFFLTFFWISTNENEVQHDLHIYIHIYLFMMVDTSSIYYIQCKRYLSQLFVYVIYTKSYKKYLQFTTKWKQKKCYLLVQNFRKFVQAEAHANIFIFLLFIMLIYIIIYNIMILLQILWNLLFRITLLCPLMSVSTALENQWYDI